MRFILSIFIIAFCALVAEYYFAWWSIAVVCFFVTLFIKQSPGKAFLAGFLGMALLWFAVALIKDIPNHHILSQKMAVLFHLPGYPLFIVVTALIGGVAGGCATWAGALVRRAF